MTLLYLSKAMCKILILLILFSGSAVAHETHGWKHATETIGPAISGRYCPGLGTVQIWGLDENDDGELDGCVLIIYIHEKIHIRPVILKDGTCECPR